MLGRRVPQAVSSSNSTAGGTRDASSRISRGVCKAPQRSTLDAGSRTRTAIFRRATGSRRRLTGRQLPHLRRCHQACGGFWLQHQIRDRLSNQVRNVIPAQYFMNISVIPSHIWPCQVISRPGAGPCLRAWHPPRRAMSCTTSPIRSRSDRLAVPLQVTRCRWTPSPARDCMHGGTAGPPSASPTSAPGRRTRPFTVRDGNPRIRPFPGTADLEAICLPVFRRNCVRSAVRSVNRFGTTRSLGTGVKGVA